MTIVGASQLEWDEVILCLWDLLPCSYDNVDCPARFWPSAMEKAARQSGIAFDYCRVPDWESYDRGFIELSESEILDSIFSGSKMPQGRVIVSPETRHSEKNRDQPEIMPTSVLPDYLEDWPNEFFNSADLIFLFPEARLITTFMHEGWFTHIACPSASNLI